MGNVNRFAHGAAVSFSTDAVSQTIVEQLRDDSFEILLTQLKGSAAVSDHTLTITLCRDIERA